MTMHCSTQPTVRALTESVDRSHTGLRHSPRDNGRSGYARHTNCQVSQLPTAPRSHEARRSPVRHFVAARGLARDILTSQAANIEGDPMGFLDVTEAYWSATKRSKHEPYKKGPQVVHVLDPATPLVSPDTEGEYDVMVCGGTLGLMVATTLQQRGHKVVVVDKRLIQGRTQEWNISRGELSNLARVGLLSEEELQSCIASEFNPVRVGFAGGPELWVNDCLNLGVSPRKLLDLIKAKFVAAGGTLLENHSFQKAEVVEGQGARVTLVVHGVGTQGAALSLADVNRPNGLGGNSSNLAPPFTPVTSSGHTPQPARTPPRKMKVAARLLLDCMGHYSDIVKQMRGRAKPDGMCLVVGSCAEGFPLANNTFGDLLYTVDDARDDLQMFWEAFPAEGGAARTTYMFAYSDAEPGRPSFEALLDRYFEGLQQYQGLPASALRFKRVLFGGFPCWSNGPLQPQWDHIMQVGDASATQSPLSFGGFGAMLRHLGRLTEGLDDALRCGALSREELCWMHPYQPSLAASWLFQRSMSIGVGQLHAATQQHHQQHHSPAQQLGHLQQQPLQQLQAPSVGGTGVHAGAAFANTLGDSGMAGAVGVMATTSSNGLSSGSRNGVPAFNSLPATAQAGANGAVTSSSSLSSRGAKGRAQGREEATEPKPVPWVQLPVNHVNRVLACNFGVMRVLGDRVLRPFLQDTIQLLPLTLSMTGMMLRDPLAISRVLLQVGPKTLATWFVHYTGLLVYTALHWLLAPVRAAVRAVASKGSSPPASPQQHLAAPTLTPGSPTADAAAGGSRVAVWNTSSEGRSRAGYGVRRFFDVLEVGSSSDYTYHAPTQPAQAPADTMFHLPGGQQALGQVQGVGQGVGQGVPLQLASSRAVGGEVLPVPAVVLAKQP